MFLIQTVYAHEYNDYAEHLKRLSKNDRRLRFGMFVDDQWLEDWASKLDGRGGILRGVYDDNAQLRGTVEIHHSERGGVCELGITVEPNLRGHGLGGRLFEAGVRWASARGYERVFIYCLRENKAMQAIARKGGMQIEYEGSDSHAYVRVENNPVGRWNEVFEDFTSRFVYWLNRMRVR